MLHGVIPVRKPKGMTSHDVVHHIRRLAGQKKVGHTGTLDPEVEGVLAVCLGQATRIAQYIQDLPKRYQATMTLGIATDTQDQSGNVLEESPVHSLEVKRVEAVFQRFVGKIEQIPPMYSAVKVDGRKLYDLAREGKVIKRNPRTVTIYSLELTGIEEGRQPRIHFDVKCSKGTYIRTLCVDLGRALGYPAHMSHLVRTKSAFYTLEDTWTLEELNSLAENGDLGKALTEIGEALGQFPCVEISSSAYSWVMNGRPLQMDDGKSGRNDHLPPGSLFRVFTEDGYFCALYRLKNEQTAIPEKVFRVR
ncbi:tRNA pseudouridine(55) synthase TruB [Melghirimyces algeriensis]|uniref:tRNA pseudouridine synthase B n=1 Tax=Melghirimyces algeriensis TaxID=910412 RepID=A0A521C5E9_9BACL|nr:tRNA pseudouridine(55) synthase TruB [Melghirimyces algeriensis]SMO53900.1 tRNA pseudouridine55 synthase [Melghirimyces algeriensis]